MEKIPRIKQKIAEYSIKIKKGLLAVFVPQEENKFLPEALKSECLFLYGASLLAVKIALVSLVLILPSTGFFSSITANRLVSLINQARQENNLPALTLSSSLNSAANLKVNDMAAKNYFEHTSPAGITPWFWFKQIGYNYLFAGENLAMGFTETEEVFNAWMNSPSHRDNILNPNFQEMGLAVGTGNIQNRQETLAVLEFGKQAQPAVKTKTAQNAPAKSTPSPLGANASPAASQKPAVPSPSAPIVSIAPAATGGIAPEKNLQEQIALKTILGGEPLSVPTGAARAVSPAVETGYVPQVLGAFISRSDEIFKSLYLYFTLFLAIALLVNIFVKIEIQYWTTIGATTFVILLSTILIFI